MDAKFINPALDSIVNVLSTMARMQLTPTQPYLKKDESALGIITAIIDMHSKETRTMLSMAFQLRPLFNP